MTTAEQTHPEKTALTCLAHELGTQAVAVVERPKPLLAACHLLGGTGRLAALPRGACDQRNAGGQWRRSRHGHVRPAQLHLEWWGSRCGVGVRVRKLNLGKCKAWCGHWTQGKLMYCISNPPHPTLEKQCLRSRMNAFSCCVLRAVVRHTARQYWKGVSHLPVSGLALAGSSREGRKGRGGRWLALGVERLWHCAAAGWQQQRRSPSAHATHPSIRPSPSQPSLPGILSRH